VNRKHAIIIAVMLAGSIVAGAFAAVKTTSVGARSGDETATPVAAEGTGAANASSGLMAVGVAAEDPLEASIAEREAELDKLESAIERKLAKKPPKLPPLPKVGERIAATGAPLTQYVTVYRRAQASSGAEHEPAGAEANDEGRDEGDGAPSHGPGQPQPKKPKKPKKPGKPEPSHENPGAPPVATAQPTASEQPAPAGAPQGDDRQGRPSGDEETEDHATEREHDEAEQQADWNEEQAKRQAEWEREQAKQAAEQEEEAGEHDQGHEG
jgi:hypothetical protein